MLRPTAASNSQRTIGSISPTDTARTRFGSTAATVRRIRSAIRRLECEHSRLGAGLALAGRHRERPLSRRQPGHGLAARRFGRTDGKEPARADINARAAGGRPSARDAAGDPALRAAGRSRRMAAHDTGRRQPARRHVWSLSSRQPPPSAGAGADIAVATGAVVVRRRTGAWRGTDAGADLSWALPGG